MIEPQYVTTRSLALFSAGLYLVNICLILTAAITSNPKLVISCLWTAILCQNLNSIINLVWVRLTK